MGIVIADKPHRSLLDPFELVDSAAGDQTEEAYSRIGWTYVLYAFALESSGLDRMFGRRKAMTEFAFYVMLSMKKKKYRSFI